jgi:phosphohistidine phosphatase
VRVLLVRHGIAEEHGAGAADRDRALTAEGVRRFRVAARALGGLEPELGSVWTSPYRRARQTAELLVAEHPGAPLLVERPELAPGGDPAVLVSSLEREAESSVLALVGHEPDLSRLEGLLLTGRAASLAVLKKGGAAALELARRRSGTGAVLLWHLTARQLRQLAP